MQITNEQWHLVRRLGRYPREGTEATGACHMHSCFLGSGHATSGENPMIVDARQYKEVCSVRAEGISKAVMQGFFFMCHIYEATNPYN